MIECRNNVDRWSRKLIGNILIDLLKINTWTALLKYVPLLRSLEFDTRVATVLVQSKGPIYVYLPKFIVPCHRGTA